MGEYVYSVRKKTVSLLVDGKPQKAAVLKYLYKPYHGLSDWDKKHRQMQVMLAENASRQWDGISKKPHYIIWIHEKLENGDPVYLWTGAPVWSDSSPRERIFVGGKPVGQAIRVTRGLLKLVRIDPNFETVDGTWKEDVGL